MLFVMIAFRLLLVFAVLTAGAGFGAVEPATARPSAQAISARLAEAEAAMLDDPRDVIILAAAARRDLDSVVDVGLRNQLAARALWLEGEAAGRLGDIALADRSLRDAAAAIRAADPQSVLHARIILSQGATSFDKGEVQAAFKSFSTAFRMFSARGDTRGQAMALQSMGLIYLDAGDYERVLRYYAQSAELHPGDRKLALSAYNNQALALKEMGRLEASEADYGRALAIAREIGSTANEVIILANVATVALARNQIDRAEQAANSALRVGRRGAPQSLPLVWAAQAQIAFMRGDVQRTIDLVPRALGSTPIDRTSFLFRNLHQVASDAYLKLGDPASALQHLRAANRLDAEAREIRSSANAAMMAAQFDFSSQELRIARRDAALGKSRARTQMILLGASLLLLAASLIAFFWVRRSRDQTREANVQLNRALAAKSEFLATTSHEIRTPLNGIMGMTQVLMHTPGIALAVQERIALIDGAGKAMKAIVDDLLDMAKIEAGESIVDRTAFALVRMLDETVRIWAAEAEAKAVEIMVDIARAPTRIIEDERKLRQIVFNLVSNAVKFTPAGRITLKAAREGNRLIITVIDTGIGIPAEQLDAIFDPFHQVDGATTRQHSGTGLGLAISSKLAAELGGRISVDSQLGSGSRFTLDLPLTIADDDIPGPENKSAASIADARVLLLDKNPDYQSMLGATLEGKVGAFASANSFADALMMPDFDILIVDRDTLGQAPLDLLSGAMGTGRVLTLASSDMELQEGSTVVVKQMPPSNILPALHAMACVPSR